MRIRHKPWAKPELEACPFYISEPKLNRGHWNTIFPGEKKPLVAKFYGKEKEKIKRLE